METRSTKPKAGSSSAGDDTGIDIEHPSISQLREQLSEQAASQAAQLAEQAASQAAQAAVQAAHLYLTTYPYVHVLILCVGFNIDYPSFEIITPRLRKGLRQGHKEI